MKHAVISSGYSLRIKYFQVSIALSKAMASSLKPSSINNISFILMLCLVYLIRVYLLNKPRFNCTSPELLMEQLFFTAMLLTAVVQVTLVMKKGCPLVDEYCYTYKLLVRKVVPAPRQMLWSLEH